MLNLWLFYLTSLYATPKRKFQLVTLNYMPLSYYVQLKITTH